jgi:monofunctional biosynthetic peptidoglycan transglycosylase
MKRSRSAWRVTGRFVLGAVAACCCVISYSWLALPDVRPLRLSNPTTTAFMTLRAEEADRVGQPIRKEQRWIAYDRLPASLKQAVLASEDARFWHHDGVDYEELRAALEDGWKGRGFRGASTITQQLAKNLYLSPSRNPYRKFVELLITRRLEVELSKRRILELYLNEIEWGDGLWGADAAARAYFGESAANLTPAQSALLAAAIINPRVFNPAHPDARLLRRQQIILSRMGDVAVSSSPSETPRAGS